MIIFSAKTLRSQHGIMTLRKHTRHFPKAKWRVICTHFQLSTCMSTLYTADVNIPTMWRRHVACYRENVTYYRENNVTRVKKKKRV